MRLIMKDSTSATFQSASVPLLPALSYHGSVSQTTDRGTEIGAALGRSRRPAKPVCNGGEYFGSAETTGYRTIPHTVDVELEKFLREEKRNAHIRPLVIYAESTLRSLDV